MRAAAGVGVVADEDVALAEALDGIALQDLVHDHDERAQVHGDVLGLRDHLPPHVEEGRRAILALLDVRGVRGLDQGLAYLLGDRQQRGADDVEGDPVAQAPPVMLASLPRSSAADSLPPESTVVQSTEQTIA